MTIINEHRSVLGVGGFSSDSGKTTLMCEILRALPGWEAIKTTRGHYRSCGKDPHACCVSHLLNQEPVVRSGRADTYEIGKDTGRYWDAGAANVHWMIATEDQVEPGIVEALTRVKSEGVLVEGNSFSEYIPVDAMIMVVRESQATIKRSARRALDHTSAFYVWCDINPNRLANDVVADVLKGNDSLQQRAASIPCYTSATLPELLSELRSLRHSAVA